MIILLMEPPTKGMANKSKQLRVGKTGKKKMIKSKVNTNLKMEDKKQEQKDSLNKLLNVIIDKNNRSVQDFINKLTSSENIQKHLNVSPKVQNVNKNLQIRSKSHQNNFQVQKNKLKGNIEKATQEKYDRLKEVMQKKQQLMQKLRQVDGQLQNAHKEDIEVLLKSRLQEERSSPTIGNYSNTSPMRIKDNVTYSVQKHQKAIQMLKKLNYEKCKKQQKLITYMKKKQQQQVKRVNQIQLSRIWQLQQIQRKRNNRIDALFKKSQIPIINNNSQHIFNHPTQLKESQLGFNEFFHQKIQIQQNNLSQNHTLNQNIHIPLHQNNQSLNSYINNSEVIEEKQKHNYQQVKSQQNIIPHKNQIDQDKRPQQKNQTPLVLKQESQFQQLNNLSERILPKNN